MLSGRWRPSGLDSRGALRFTSGARERASPSAVVDSGGAYLFSSLLGRAARILKSRRYP